MALTTQPNMAVANIGGIQGRSLLLFCCRNPVVAGDLQYGRERFRECQGAAAKRERRSIREGPGVLSVSRADTEGTANNDCRAKAPVTGRNKAFQTKFEMPPPQPFLLHHQKAHLLFLGKEDGGFEAAGLPRHSRPDGKKSRPRGGAAKPSAFADFPRAPKGRTSALPQGRPHKSRRASPAPLKPLCTVSRTPPVGCRGGPSRSECRRSPRPA